MDKKVLHFENVSIEYNTKRGMLHAVTDVSFDVREGESVAVIGESGCGKTTLATSVVGILPNNATITSGKAVYSTKDGRELDLYSLDKKEMRPLLWSDIAIMFQASQSSFNPVRKIYTQFFDTFKAHGFKLSKEEMLERSKRVLEMVMLDPEKVLYSFPHELSGGMKQRTLLALSLILEPRLLILDEPTTALDLITQEKILILLNRLRKEMNFAVMFITHDLSIVSELADRTVVMYSGRLVEDADVKDFFLSSKHPYSRGLLKAIPKLTASSDDLYSIPGKTPDLVDVPKGCLFAPRCEFANSECFETLPSYKYEGNSRVFCNYAFKEKTNGID